MGPTRAAWCPCTHRRRGKRLLLTSGALFDLYRTEIHSATTSLKIPLVRQEARCDALTQPMLEISHDCRDDVHPSLAGNPG